VDRATQDALERAKERLDRHAGRYARPVSLRGVRILVVPWLFRLPWLSRFDGYALHGTVLLREEPQLDDDLLVHELCHVWQMQHRPLAMPLSYLRHGYARNHYEEEARLAAAGGRGCDQPAGRIHGA
jgi:hypothetical protein